MAANQLQLRVNFGHRELEVVGTNEEVREWYDRLEPLFSKNIKPLPAPLGDNGTADSEESDPWADKAFGQILQEYPRDISDVDRALIAGKFIQETTADRVFTTSAVNDLLKDHGVRLPNPSVSVMRNLKSGRVFIQSKGLFRVSRAGIQYLQGLGSAGNASA